MSRASFFVYSVSLWPYGISCCWGVTATSFALFAPDDLVPLASFAIFVRASKEVRISGPDFFTSTAHYSNVFATHASPLEPASPGAVFFSSVKQFQWLSADTVAVPESVTNSFVLVPPTVFA